MSFSRRLTLAAAGAVAAAILILSGITYLIVREQLLDEVDDGLRQAAGRVDNIRSSSPPPVPAPPPPGQSGGSGMGGGRTQGGPRQIPFPIRVGRGEQLGGPGGFVQVVLPTGEILRQRNADVELPVTREALDIARGEREESFHDATVDGVHVRILTMRGPVDGIALQIARPLTEVDSVLGRLRWILFLVSAAGIALAAAAGLVVARSALAPVRRLTDTAEHVASTQDLSQRIADSSRDELGRLGTAFNRMLDALGRSRAAQQQLVADASHELRTPLTSMRANLELLQAGDRLPEHEREAVLRDLVSQTDELTGLVGDLVDLARDGEQPYEFDIVRLDEVVRTAVTRGRLRAPWMQFLDTDVDPTEVMGDRAALERAVINLLDNAIKFSPEGGSIEVAVHGGRIAVRDHGPGIPEEDLPLVFDRFYRTDEARSRPGSGLGLAIVRQVAEAHGGTAVAQQAHGGGALLVIDIPPLSETPEDA